MCDMHIRKSEFCRIVNHLPNPMSLFGIKPPINGKNLKFYKAIKSSLHWRKQPIEIRPARNGQP